MHTISGVSNPGYVREVKISDRFPLPMAAWQASTITPWGHWLCGKRSKCYQVQGFGMQIQGMHKKRAWTWTTGPI